MRAALFTILLFFISAPAFADCATVTMGPQPAGKIIYNSDAKFLQYCDGTDWVPMHYKAGTGIGGCTNPETPEGQMIYRRQQLEALKGAQRPGSQGTIR